MSGKRSVKAVSSGTSDPDVERERSRSGLDSAGRLGALFQAKRKDVRVSV